MSNAMKEILDMLSRHEKLQELRATLTEQLIKQKMLDEKDNQKNMLSHETILERLTQICDLLTRTEEEEKYKGFLLLGGLTAKIDADLYHRENEEEDEEECCQHDKEF